MNFKLRTLLVATFALLSVATQAKTPVEKHGELRVEGARLVGEDGTPAVLHGVSMGWHSFWPRWYNPDAVAEVVNVWKADVVRAAIGVHPRPMGYLADPEGSWKCLEGVVEGALASGAYVIVDWHSHAIETDAAVDFFTRVAQKWGKYPNIIYEIYNEPIRDSWDDVKAYSRTVIDAIRAIDPTGIILVGSPHWDQDIHLVAADPLTGYDNIMYTMHFYAATHKNELRERTQAAIDTGLPVFLSECAAMEASGNGRLDFESWREWERLADRNGLSWVVWSLSEKDETCSMILDGSVPATGGWTDSDLKEWGRFVRNRLQAGWPAQESKTVKLFNGRNLDGWVGYLDDPSLDPAKEFTVKKGTIRLSGKLGYLRTERSYTDYKLDLEWRWSEEASNSGIFLRIQPGEGPFPEGFECQLQAGNAGDLFELGRAKVTHIDGAPGYPNQTIKLLPSNEKAVGKWNRAEIVCRGDVIDIYINGEHQNHVTGTSRYEGYVALQSEGAPVEFRNVKITPLE
jgi:endoglucanase